MSDIVATTYKAGLAPVVIDLSDLEVPALGGRMVRPFDGETVTIETLLDGAEERELADALGSLSKVGAAVTEAAEGLAAAKAALTAARAGQHIDGTYTTVEAAEAALAAAEDAVAAADAAAESSFDDVVMAMSVIVHEWTVTDKYGEPLPPPSDPAGWRRLNSAQQKALIERIMGGATDAGESAEARGKGSAASRNGASGTRRR